MEPELTFVTSITNYIRAEQICHVGKFQLSILNLNNLWSFIEFLAVFVPNLCGEKSVRRKSAWRKNDIRRGLKFETLSTGHGIIVNCPSAMY